MAVDTSKKRLEKLKARRDPAAGRTPSVAGRRLSVLTIVLIGLVSLYVRSRSSAPPTSRVNEPGDASAPVPASSGEPRRNLIAEWERDHPVEPSTGSQPDHQDSVPSLGRPLEGDVGVRNSAGRSGRYYLPAGYAQKMLPLAVLIHGTGGSGANMVSDFRALADEYGFAIVAPDSRRSPDGQLTWQVGESPGEITEDLQHTMSCVRALRAIEGVQVDSEKTLIAGFSGGGSSAPYMASHESFFRTFAVLHGGVIANGFGSNRVRGWFSTGDSDGVRPVEGVRAALDELRREGWSTELELRTYPGAHELTEREKRDVVRWWLGR